MEKQKRLVEIQEASRARIEKLIIEKRGKKAVRFKKILSEMIDLAERKGNVLIMDRQEFNNIDRFLD